jgi:hypothetical protein
MRFLRATRYKGGAIIHICKDSTETEPVGRYGGTGTRIEKMYCGLKERYYNLWNGEPYNDPRYGEDNLQIWELGLMCRSCVKAYYNQHNPEDRDVDLDFGLIGINQFIDFAFEEWKKSIYA